MLELKGKYAEALVMIDDVEEDIISQIFKVLNHPTSKGQLIRIMPDTHVGNGCVIGFTSTVGEYVIPNLIGVDIGCGVLSVNVGKIDINLEEFDKAIHSLIPSGPNIRDTKHSTLLPLLHKDIVEIGEKIEMDINRAVKSVGTLGGGNHFIELGIDPEDNKWITIHSGSRKFGEMICKYHQNIAKKTMNQMFIGDAYKDLEFITGQDMKNYIADMEIATEYADINRWAMMSEILRYLNNIKPCNSYIHSIHNYIETDHGRPGIVRKGAVSAKTGELLVIPFNMRDGIAVCTGKGSKKWNYSAPHGAGRILSRKKAKAQLSLDEFQAQMNDAGIFTSTANSDTLDEAPGAYKDKDLILSCIKETVDFNFLIKPLYNFKASN